MVSLVGMNLMAPLVWLAGLVTDRLQWRSLLTWLLAARFACSRFESGPVSVAVGLVAAHALGRF